MASPPPPIGKDTQPIALDDLLLDVENPRFGFPGKDANQADIVDRIASKFGVQDVISSLAVNGYFAAEPLVCRPAKEKGKFVVAEGNRRLAACLILAGDKRGARQDNLAKQYRPIWEAHGKKQIDPLPCIVFGTGGDQNALLSYLGVRHIASAQPWDSYAKAAWVARVVEAGNLNLDDVALMIGDQHRTVVRLLEGYYFINQLIAAGEFHPDNSQRKGRGSVTEYPFSWVYTLLGYQAARGYLKLGDKDKAEPNPLEKEDLARGGLVVRAMFGDRSSGRSAAISDSRELGNLASALADPEKVSLLEQGRSVSEITRMTQPLEDRLRYGLAEVREIQNDLTRGLSETEIAADVAAPFVELAQKNRNSASDLARRLADAARGEPGDG